MQLCKFVCIEVNASLLFHFNLCWRAYEIYIPRSKQILNMDVFYFQMCLWYSWKQKEREREKRTVCQWAERLFTMNNELVIQQNIFASLDQIKRFRLGGFWRKCIWTVWWIWCNCRLERQNKPLQQNCCAKSTFRSTAYKMKKNARTSSHLTDESQFPNHLNGSAFRPTHI